MQIYIFILDILNQYHVVYDKDSIYEKVKKLIDETTILRNMYLKYTILPKNIIYDIMVEKIGLIKKKEELLLDYLLRV